MWEIHFHLQEGRRELCDVWCVWGCVCVCVRQISQNMTYLIETGLWDSEALMLGEVKGSSSSPAIAPEPIFLDLYNFYIRSCGSCGETLSLCIFLKKQVDKLSVYHTQGLDQNRKFFRQSQDITSARGNHIFFIFSTEWDRRGGAGGGGPSLFTVWQ